METGMWIILFVFTISLGLVGTVHAVPPLDLERAYDKADFIFYGEVLSLEILSKSIQTQDKNSYRETPGKVVYSIKIQDFIKNSFEDKIISASGEYLDKPHGMSYTPNIYKIGDKLVFYIHNYDGDRYSYDYYINSAASHYIPSECKYDLPTNTMDLIYDVHSCSWKKITYDDEPDTSMCGPGTAYVNGVCHIVLKEEPHWGSPDCLIATASYGSELAPQVQMLREIRDNTLLNTESGKIFMSGFNSVYYSFSPQVAQLENKNPIFKEAVKLFITPMITTLSIMTLAEEDSEFDVLFFGMSSIGLITGMYVVAPVVLVWKIRDRR